RGKRPPPGERAFRTPSSMPPAPRSMPPPGAPGASTTAPRLQRIEPGLRRLGALRGGFPPGGEGLLLRPRAVRILMQALGLAPQAIELIGGRRARHGRVAAPRKPERGCEQEKDRRHGSARPNPSRWGIGHGSVGRRARAPDQIAAKAS